MHIHAHRAAPWAGGVKTAVGFALTFLLLLIVNVFVYQKMRQLSASCPEMAQGDEMLRALVCTDLFAVMFLSVMVLLLNRQLGVRDTADRAARQLHEEQTHRLSERIEELTRLNQTLQAAHTEWRRVEGQLVGFQKMESLGKLIGGVSHEFNNYLTVILGFSEQLLLQLPPGTGEHATVAEIFKAGERSAELTRGLLGLVRTGESGPRPIDVNRQVDGMRRMLNVLVGKRVRLEIVLQGNLPLVKTVPGHIEQVLLNLTANARDAMPDGGRVSIETRTVDLDATANLPPGRYVLLSVTDSGHGIDEATRQQMFDPFYTTKEQGTGLGLSTVREIVVGGGGCVLAESMPGKGATFNVYWPAMTLESERAARGPAHDTVCHPGHGTRDTWPG